MMLLLLASSPKYSFFEEPCCEEDEVSTINNIFLRAETAELCSKSGDR